MQLMSVPMAPPANETLDKFPSGSWSFGPLTVNWSIKSNNEIDVNVSVLGIDIDNLTATLSANNAAISDQLNVLGLVKGTLALTAKFHQGPSQDGLWISGQITAGSWSSGQLNHRIIPW